MMQNSDSIDRIEDGVRMGGRQLEFDIAKGIAILCVIVGHLDVVFLQHLVFLFHMPIFFLISGYFLSTRRPLGKFVRKKARGLLVPYYFTGALIYLCSIPMSLARGQDWMVNAGRWLGGVLYGAPAIWQVPFLWPEFPSFIGALWFLLALFWASLFVRMALALPRRWMTTVLVIGAAVIAWASAQRIFLPLDVQPGLTAAVFVLAGVWLRQSSLLQRPARWYVVLAALALWGWCLTHYHDFYLAADIFEGGLRDWAAAFAVSWLVFLVSRRLLGTRPGHVLAWYGTYSIYILAFHIIELDLVPWGTVVDAFRAAAVPAWLLWTAILVVKVVWATGMTCFVRRIPLFRSVYETR